jgi:tryptophan synthase beta chain
LYELEEAYERNKNEPEFQRELNKLLANYTERPSLLYYAKNLTEETGGAKIYLKREDLNHTSSHKINNVLGQVLLAKHMGKTRVIAETNAGEHGVAVATAFALMGMECEVFMGKEDTERQSLNVYCTLLLGAKVHTVTSGTMTLKNFISRLLSHYPFIAVFGACLRRVHVVVIIG